MWIGSFRDPVLISQIDDFLKRCKEHLATKFKHEKFEVAFKAYGKDGTMGEMEPDQSVGKEICLIGEIQAENQILATQIANVGRVFCVHAPYKGQQSTTGNFAMPVTPLEIPLGPVTAFNVYHLLPVKDATELFPISVRTVGPSTSSAVRDPSFGFDLIKPEPFTNGTITNGTQTNGHHHDESEPNCTSGTSPSNKFITGQTPLTSLAKDIRSKNAGPYEITFDIIF